MQNGKTTVTARVLPCCASPHSDFSPVTRMRRQKHGKRNSFAARREIKPPELQADVPFFSSFEGQNNHGKRACGCFHHLCRLKTTVLAVGQRPRYLIRNRTTPGRGKAILEGCTPRALRRTRLQGKCPSNRWQPSQNSLYAEPATFPGRGCASSTRTAFSDAAAADVYNTDSSTGHSAEGRCHRALAGRKDIATAMFSPARSMGKRPTGRYRKPQRLPTADTAAVHDAINGWT